MPIRAERIKADIEAIAACTETPATGASRPTFSPSWRKARDYVASQLEAAGCKMRIDACGNLHARPSAISWESPVWVSGSHLDSVPNGGNFDGVVGVVTPLEVMRAAREDLKVAIPLELIIWAEEEGTTFGLGMLGSRSFIGELKADDLRKWKNAGGQDYIEAGASHGVNPELIGKEVLKPGLVIGLIEVHIEQGPSLWNSDHALALVTAIAGRRQYRCTLTGVANHAGSTHMEHRADALAGAADVILQLERLAKEFGKHTVATVGQIAVKPNAINVINEQAVFSIDFRCAETDVMIRGDRTIHTLIAQIAKARHLQHELVVTESQPSMDMHAIICNKIRRVASVKYARPIAETVSGALHDAAIVAPLVPTAMIFVASQDGISHNPAEYSRNDDIAEAAELLFDTVKDRRLE